MKLEKETVDRRVNLLRAEGIEFITNADIGKNVDVNELSAHTTPSHSVSVLPSLVISRLP